VESVAWVSERKDVLAGALFMLTLWWYVDHVKRSGSWRRQGLVVSTLVLALLAKPMVVTLPFVLLLLDYWPLARLCEATSGAWPQKVLVRKALHEKLPLFVVVATVSAITYIVQRDMGAMQALGDLGPGWRIANGLHTYCIYVLDAFWPSGLSVFYPHPMESIPLWQVAAAGSVLGVTTVAVGYVAGPAPYAIVGWLWYLGMLVPVLGLVQVGLQARADRYMYLPLIGLSIVVAWGAVDLANRWRMPELALAVAGAIVIGLLGVVAFEVGVWRATETLYSHALLVTDGNHVAHKGLASELLRRGKVEQAGRHYEAAARLRPEWQEPRLGSIDVALAQGRTTDGLRMLRAEIERTPDNPEVNGRYALLLGSIGRYSEARDRLEAVIEVRPGVAELRRAMAEIEIALGNSRAAIEQGREALRLAPDYTEAANNLAWVLSTTGDADVCDPAEAIRLVERFALESSDPGTLDTLAAAYAANGRFSEAAGIAERVVRGAEATGMVEAARDFRAREMLYRGGHAYVDPLLAAQAR